MRARTAKLADQILSSLKPAFHTLAVSTVNHAQAVDNLPSN